MKRATLVLLALLAASPAEAHLMNTGFGPFYDGLAHPLLTIEDLLPLIAVALLAGLGGARAGRWVVFALPSAWLAGMIAGRHLASSEPATLVIPILTIATGALVAADRRLPVPAVGAAALLLGLVHGWQNGPGFAQARAVTGVLGVACTVFVVATIVAGTVVSLRKGWMRIAVRVAGSWIAAIGLLMLGWSLRNGHP